MIQPGTAILLVDDEPAKWPEIVAALAPLGAGLVHAATAQEALQQATANDFAVILLSLRRPGMDRFALARQLRAQAQSSATPILFLSGCADGLSACAGVPGTVEQGEALGAVDFVTLPIAPAALRARVSFFLDLHRSREDLRVAKLQAVNGQAFLAAVLETVEDGIVACGPDGVLTLFNRASRELHGLPETPLPPDQWARHYDLFQPDGHTRMDVREVPLFRALAGEKVRNVEMIVAPKSGVPRTLLASGQPLYDPAGRKLGAVVSMHDVTAARDAQAARELSLREQARRQEAEAAADAIRDGEQRYRDLFDAIDEGLCVIEMISDPAGRPVDYRILEANPAFEKQSGLVDAVGKTILELVPGFDGHWFETYGEVARTGEPVRLVDEAKALGRWFDVYANRIGGPGSRKVSVLFTDITERIRAEDDLRRLAAELSEQDRRKTEFLATLAHELRNPLAPIRNGLRIIGMATGDPRTLDRTREMMDRQVGHMVRLIDDLLDIARVSSGKVDLRKENVTLRAVVAGAVETSLPLIEASGHQLTLRIPDEPVLLNVDPTRLAQVLSNLLNNAAKYTPDGGRIELSAALEKDQVTVSVTDSGVGIPEESLMKVFQMFNQVGRNMDRAQGGLGIGLSLVRGLVELHGGTVTAASEGSGKGSTFSMRLPQVAPGLAQQAAAAPDAADADADADAGAGAGALVAAQSFRVLVVDDNVDAAESLAMIIEMGGHTTRVANDGQQALQVAGEFSPEVVFLDIGMPGKNGYEVARELRKTANGRQPVLVALTGWGADSDRLRSREAGFDHHLTKPAEIAAVEQLLAGVRRPPL